MLLINKLLKLKSYFNYFAYY